MQTKIRRVRALDIQIWKTHCPSLYRLLSKGLLSISGVCRDRGVSAENEYEYRAG